MGYNHQTCVSWEKSKQGCSAVNCFLQCNRIACIYLYFAEFQKYLVKKVLYATWFMSRSTCNSRNNYRARFLRQTWLLTFGNKMKRFTWPGCRKIARLDSRGQPLLSNLPVRAFISVDRSSQSFGQKMERPMSLESLLASSFWNFLHPPLNSKGGGRGIGK